MKTKFKEFLKKLNIEPTLESVILEGFETLFEDGEGAGGTVAAALPGVTDGKVTVSIHKAAPWIQNETAKNFKRKSLKKIYLPF